MDRRAMTWLAALGLAVLAVGGSIPIWGGLTPEPVAAKDDEKGKEKWIPYGEAFRWSGALRPGMRLVVETVNGEIRAEAGTGSEGLVEGTRRVREDGEEWEDVEIRVEEKKDKVHIWVEHHEEKAKDVRWVRVDFRVVVPPGVTVAPSTVNGSIRAEGIRGPIDASSVNGSIRISGTEEISASAVNGNVYAEVSDPQRKAPVQLETVNGQIELTLARDASADISASAVNGSISSDWPLEVEGELWSKKVDTRLGKGGPRYELSTVNGSIRLRMPGV